MGRAAPADDCTLAEKVAFLSRPDAYPGRPRAVQAIETHMSWVFLAGADAYKLKKPDRIDGYDLRTVALRERHGLEELRLNRRFSEDVYLGLTPLVRTRSGSLALAGRGEPVDWLVRMRRLPADLMLDRQVRENAVDTERLREAVAMVGRVYMLAPPERGAAATYRRRLASRVLGAERELRAFPDAIPVPHVRGLATRLRAGLEDAAASIEARVAEGRLVEGHGDLRAEHVCLEPRPVVIDCLDFSRILRVVDPAEELGFLALDCDRLGAPRLGPLVFEAYGAVSGDWPPPRLVRVYQAVHALVRASLAIRHLRDREVRDPARWAAQACDYLRLADARLAPAAA